MGYESNDNVPPALFSPSYATHAMMQWISKYGANELAG
jgi:hypothetical protein